MAPHDENSKTDKTVEKNFFSFDDDEADKHKKIYGGENIQDKDGFILTQAEAEKQEIRKKKEQALEDIKLISELDKALNNAHLALGKAAEYYNEAKQVAADVEGDIDRADYLKDEILRAQKILQKGTLQDKNSFLLEQGLTQDQIDALTPEQRDQSIFDIQSDMIEEYGTLRDKIALQAERFDAAEAKFNKALEKADEEIAKAEKEGASPEKLQELYDRRDALKDGFEQTKREFGQTMKGYLDNHQDFDQVLAEIQPELSDSFTATIEDHVNDTRTIFQESITDPFNMAANHETPNPFDLDQEKSAPDPFSSAPSSSPNPFG